MLVKSGKIKEIILHCGGIKNENDEDVDLEDLLEYLPNAYSM